jgi:CRISPR-associated endonuclease/helicase Cas3
MSELLAKSPRGEHRVTLLEHSLDVLDAAESLFGWPEPTLLARAWLRLFKIPGERFPDFAINLRTAAVFHDLGKANNGFQAALLGKGEQLIRHEHLSTLVLALDGVTAWLRTRDDLDVDVVLSAILTHHLKASLPELARPLDDRLILRVMSDHGDVQGLLRQAAERIGLSPSIPDLSRYTSWAFRDHRAGIPAGMVDLQGHRDFVRDRRLRPFELQLRKDEERRRLLWAIRSGLIAADAAASGLPRVGMSIRPWLEAVFAPRCTCDEAFIAGEVIARRIADLQQRGSWQDWSDFQKEAAHLPDRGLLLAPCGSGKTLAAWRWIAERVKRRPARVLFLYPTRATAKEGFRDYVSWAPESDAALMHGTSAFDLDGMFANPDDPRHENRYEVERRLFALGFWTRRVFSATVDQFLAFLQYGYGSVCMLPVLADSVVVIDEVHSFDRAMFSALKEFLNQFDVPVLCMTATLPNARRDELVRECKLTVYEDRPGELKDIAAAPRYRLRQTTEAEAPALVREALKDGRRVLWVVNQVKRAQRAARALACDFKQDRTQDRLHVAPGIPLLCYHSRFRLADRVARHDAVVEAFRPGRPAALAITTQVCEMSLDMDADLLVSESCPITALIQRMGRCNRQRWPRPLPRSGEVLVYEPENTLPYDADALTGLPGVLARLVARDSISQAELEDALALAPSPPAVADVACSFVASGPYAMGGEVDFRDVEEFSVPAVLRSDLDGFQRAGKGRQPGFVVPVPRKVGREDRPAGFPSYLGVALDSHYHLAIGFCDRPIADMGGTD